MEQMRSAYEATAAAGAPAFDSVLVLLREPMAGAIAFVFLLATVVVALATVATFLLPELPLQSVSPAEMMRRMREAGEAPATEPVTSGVEAAGDGAS